MRLLARDSVWREEKAKKEPFDFVVYQHGEIHAAGVSSNLQPINSPKGGVHILLNKFLPPHKPIFVKIYIKFHTNSESVVECTWKEAPAEYFEYTTKYN